MSHPRHESRVAAAAGGKFFDRFHVQRLAHDALDEVRRALVAKHTDTEQRRLLKKTRFVLQKNPENRSSAERRKVAQIQTTNQPLYRAMLLKDLAGVHPGSTTLLRCSRPARWLARVGVALQARALLDACTVLQVASPGALATGRSLLLRIVQMLSKMCR